MLRSRHFLAAAILAGMPFISAQAQQFKQFKDWAVGCDNLRSCTALGLPSADAADQAAFIRVVRAGDAEALPSIELVYVSENPMSGLSLKLLVDGRPVTGLPAAPMAAQGDGYTVRTSLVAAEAKAFVDALHVATSLSLQLLQGDKPAGEARPVSLAGSAAGLLFMDDQQKRVGGVTALAGKGPAAASAMPPLPAMPKLVSLSLEELDQPLPPMPTGVKLPTDPACPKEQELALKLEGGATLWGECAFAGAYNFGFHMYLARGDSAKPQSFALPVLQGDRPKDVIVNPGVMEDHRTLNAFNKGRGIGDCGDSSDWVWDGTTFRLLRLSALPVCRGVPSDDWPQLYTARRQ